MNARRAMQIMIAVASVGLAATAHAQTDLAAADMMNLRAPSVSETDLSAFALDLASPEASPDDIAALGPITTADSAPQVSGDNVSASALPWYEQFTAAAPADLADAWGDDASELRFTAGDRWGITLGFTEPDQGPQFQLEDVSAGAFFAINDRFRLGGQVRFASPAQDVFGEPGEERAPELKFESAFRF